VNSSTAAQIGKTSQHLVGSFRRFYGKDSVVSHNHGLTNIE
jgi:hypothetical protein